VTISIKNVADLKFVLVLGTKFVRNLSLSIINFARLYNKPRKAFFAAWLIFVRLWLKFWVFSNNCNIFANKQFTGIRWPMTPVISWVVPYGRTDVTKLKLLFTARRTSLIKMHVTLYWVRPRDRRAVSYHIYRSWLATFTTKVFRKLRALLAYILTPRTQTKRTYTLQ